MEEAKQGGDSRPTTELEDHAEQEKPRSLLSSEMRGDTNNSSEVKVEDDALAKSKGTRKVGEKSSPNDIDAEAGIEVGRDDESAPKGDALRQDSAGSTFPDENREKSIDNSDEKDEGAATVGEKVENRPVGESGQPLVDSATKAAKDDTSISGTEAAMKAEPVDESNETRAPELQTSEEQNALASKSKPKLAEADGAIDPTMSTSITASVSKTVESNSKESLVGDKNEVVGDKSDGSRPVATQTSTELAQKQPEEVDFTIADQNDSHTDTGIGASNSDASAAVAMDAQEPKSMPETLVAAEVQNLQVSGPAENKTDPMDVDEEADANQPSTEEKPEENQEYTVGNADAEVVAEGSPSPSVEKTTESVESATLLESPVAVRPSFEEDLKLRIMRSVTEDTSPPPEVTKAAVWKPLSTAKVTKLPKAQSQPGLNEKQINRIRLLLLSLGSQVHRGKGSERLFTDYWDAVCLRLSDRVSSHTTNRCDTAIEAFLVSKKLRKVHNQLIMGKISCCFLVGCIPDIRPNLTLLCFL